MRMKTASLLAPFEGDVDAALNALPRAVADYRGRYGAYQERCRREGSSPIPDPNPVISPIPGAGLATFAGD